jgi:hypothetical protein
MFNDFQILLDYEQIPIVCLYFLKLILSICSEWILQFPPDLFIARVIILNVLDFPTFAIPTIPTLSELIPYLPN